MTIHVNITATRKPYDNRSVNPDEVLVPMLVNNSFLKLMPDVDKNNIRIWHLAGKNFQVAFYPVPAPFEKIALQQFYYNLNEFLGEHRDARCLVPQSDGSYKVCPKKNGNNHPDCAHCPQKGKYMRALRKVVSLDEWMDDFGYEPQPTTDDTEPIMLRLAYEDLLAYLEDKLRTLDIVTMGFDIGSEGEKFASGDLKELVQKVMEKYNVKKSRAYQLVQEAKAEVEKFFQD